MHGGNVSARGGGAHIVGGLLGSGGGRKKVCIMVHRVGCRRPVVVLLLLYDSGLEAHTL